MMVRVAQGEDWKLIKPHWRCVVRLKTVLVGVCACASFMGCSSKMAWMDPSIDLDEGKVPCEIVDYAERLMPCESGADSKNRLECEAGLLDMARTLRRTVDPMRKKDFDGRFDSGGGGACPVVVLVEWDVPYSTVGTIQILNNVLSACTLTAWPYVCQEAQAFRVSVRSPAGTRSQVFLARSRTWQSNLSPIGLLPVPGWADERGVWLRHYSEKKEIDAIVSLCKAEREHVADVLRDKSKYDKECDLFNLKWRRNESNAVEEQCEQGA